MNKAPERLPARIPQLEPGRLAATSPWGKGSKGLVALGQHNGALKHHPSLSHRRDGAIKAVKYL